RSAPARSSMAARGGTGLTRPFGEPRERLTNDASAPRPSDAFGVTDPSRASDKPVTRVAQNEDEVDSGSVSDAATGVRRGAEDLIGDLFGWRSEDDEGLLVPSPAGAGRVAT